MQTFDVVKQTKLINTTRMLQVAASFDVPVIEKSEFHLICDLDIDLKNDDWNIGMIVGPSGCGKSTILREIVPDIWEPKYSKSKSVVDEISDVYEVREITQAFASVGFNTIPAWFRPYEVLSNGERFRVDVARRILETPSESIIAVDEFTSVVDRQVASIASHAIQKYVRAGERKMIVASCHYDVIDWLQPDWILEPASNKFARRRLRRRPSLEGEIRQVKHGMWKYFAPYHYMNADLNRGAKCFALFIDDIPASFAGVVNRLHPKVRDLRAISRLVTHPDYQGIGLAMILADSLGAAYKHRRVRLRMNMTHPALIRTVYKSPCWKMIKRSGIFNDNNRKRGFNFGGRACAVFEYAGKASEQNAHLLNI